MSDRTFRVFVAVTAAVLFVVMSTPLTSGGLQDLAARLVRGLVAPTQPAAVAVAQS